MIDDEVTPSSRDAPRRLKDESAERGGVDSQLDRSIGAGQT